MSSKNILLLPGDGIGPEVMSEVERLIAWFNRNAGTKCPVHAFNVFDCNVPQDLLRRHAGEPDATKEIRAQALKMTAWEVTPLAG